tara:strand:+ start:503 stop:745 length:243 start_codon:yes stop_codon:yes gene_type:complete
MIPNKLKVAKPVSGFTEREYSSKAILNTDVASLLKYKIQKQKSSSSISELNSVKNEVSEIRNELQEIKKLLIKVTSNVDS